MTANMKILTGVTGACALIGLGFVPLFHDSAREAAAHAEYERVLNNMKADSEARLRDAKVRHAYIVDGDAVGDLYARCTSDDPPKKPANQRRCQAVIDQIEKEIAASDAAEAKAQANW